MVFLLGFVVDSGLSFNEAPSDLLTISSEPTYG